MKVRGRSVKAKVVNFDRRAELVLLEDGRIMGRGGPGRKWSPRGTSTGSPAEWAESTKERGYHVVFAEEPGA